MFPTDLLAKLSPHARVATAVAPFLGAVIFRLVTGRSRMASILMSLATTWFAVMVLMTPFSFGMQEDLERLRVWFH